jgi:hypothetical protein
MRENGIVGNFISSAAVTGKGEGDEKGGEGAVGLGAFTKVLNNSVISLNVLFKLFLSSLLLSS